MTSGRKAYMSKDKDLGLVVVMNDSEQFSAAGKAAFSFGKMLLETHRVTGMTL